jgi:hypothetical protein
MKHARRQMSVVSSAVLLALFSSCFGTVGVVEDVSVGYAPPPAYIATTPPVYYGGYPTYWYGGRWYRRDGPHWRAYRGEPPYLRSHRSHGPPPRVYYGRQHFGHGGPRWHGARPPHR